MDKIEIDGGIRLNGEVNISGAKNAALPVMAASILCPGDHRVTNLPGLRDIYTMGKLLGHLGINFQFDGDEATFNSDNITSIEAPYDFVKTMRASILVLGPLLARTGEAKVSLPGGCAIGARPVNFHTMGLAKMGAEITLEEGYIHARAKKLKGARIYFDMPSVTGTENLMMAAVLAEGTTILENAACEPEIIDLADALVTMGADISGAGTNNITINGVRELRPLNHQVIPDRIETGTFMIAAGITGGDITINRCIPAHSEALIRKTVETGMEISVERGRIRVKGAGTIMPVDIKTMPHPGFPTDMQAQFMTLMTLSNGTSLITENIFENRFMHVAELKRMGADIRIEGSTATVSGIKKLTGAPVMATDLRASASLILAGLAAEGTTVIERVYHLDRGYEKIEAKLQKMGARIRRIV